MPQPAFDPAEDASEPSMRPQSLAGFVGQEALVQQLSIFVEAARQRSESLEHTLFHGPPGLGKTSMAHIIGNEMGAPVTITAGPAIDKPGDLVALLTNLQEHAILFIDEIHRMPRAAEEILYPAMEDFRCDVMIGQGPAARSINIELPPFTLIGATTRIGMLSQPLRDRFGITLPFDLYEIAALNQIVDSSAQKLGLEFTHTTAYLGTGAIARRSRGTPRIAIRLLRRIRDFAQVKYPGIPINDYIVSEACHMLRIDDQGLDIIGRKYLHALAVTYKGSAVGIDAVASTIQEERDTLEDVYEPHLLRIGFIRRTKGGREITPEGIQHLARFSD